MSSSLPNRDHGGAGTGRSRCCWICRYIDNPISGAKSKERIKRLRKRKERRVIKEFDKEDS